MTAEILGCTVHVPMKDPLSLTATEFELVVKDLLEQAGATVRMFKVTGSQVLQGSDGDYQIDATVEFELLGAKFVTLVECKRHKDPIKREVVQILEAKLRSLGAHKGMIFSTANFQTGAIEFARAHGIALVEVRSGRTSYLTRGMDPPPRLPSWVPAFVGWVVELSESGNKTCSLLRREDPTVLDKSLKPVKMAQPANSRRAK